MAEANSSAPYSPYKPILLPALITLAVTLLRLAGELMHWSPQWFNPAPGGGGAVVGIVWLVPVFGVYFALRLTSSGQGPARPARAIGYALLGSAILVGGFLLFQKYVQNLSGLVLMWTLATLGALIQRAAWRPLFRVLLAYAYLARVPVAVIMLLATRLRWESHYSAFAMPESELNWLAQFFLFGFVPQLVWWVGFTVVAGTLFGSIAAAIALRRKAISQTAPHSQ
jgi:hypothetical protein